MFPDVFLVGKQNGEVQVRITHQSEARRNNYNVSVSLETTEGCCAYSDAACHIVGR